MVHVQVLGKHYSTIEFLQFFFDAGLPWNQPKVS